MKMIKTALLPLAILCGITLSMPALAQHHGHGGPRVHFGLYLGGPVYPPYWHYPPYYYYPPGPAYYPAPVVVAPQSPPAYIEQGSAAPADENPQSWWYYCGESKTYYPYAKTCPSGWQRVSPQPPPG